MYYTKYSIIAIAVLAATIATAVLDTTNNDHPIIGTWEMVSITYNGTQLDALDFLIGTREVYNADGTGFSFYPDYPDDEFPFRWKIEGDSFFHIDEFTPGDDWPEWGLILDISGSIMTQRTDPNNPDSPGSELIFTLTRVN